MAQLTVLNNVRGNGERSGESRDELSRGLQQLLAGTLSQVRFGRHDRMLYSTDASLYQVEPTGVVVPASIDDAARVVSWCGEQGVAMLPRGGGTSLAGQATNEAVVIDLSAMCRGIGGIEKGSRDQRIKGSSGGAEVAGAGAWLGDTVVVEAGVVVEELNEELGRRKSGLFFAPDPATVRQACIGGCLGNNAAGARSIRYKRTVENVLGIEAILASGERVWFGVGAGGRDETARRLAAGVIEVVRRNAADIRARFPRTIRRNAGYALDMILDQVEAGATAQTLDLVPLLCGSEGTLATTLRARVMLHPTPRAKGLAVISFDSVESAIAAVKPILDAGMPGGGGGLTAVELLDDVVLDAARGNIEYRRYVDLLPGADAARGEPKGVLYVEFFGFDAERGSEEIEAGFAAVRGVCERVGGVIPGGFRASLDAGLMMKAWALRRAGEPLLHGLAGARKPITFVEDNAVPVERLGEFVRGFKQIVARHGTRAAYWAHASVGVLHVRPMIDLHDPADRERMVAIAVEVADLAKACGGIMSGEHGDGRVRGPLLERFFGPELMGAFREVKRLFDPKGLMNPGNIVGAGPVGSIAEGLRVDGGEGIEGSRDQGIEVETYFDYGDSEGFGHAVERCNGAGVCRKRSGGTMCPSYMATMDERHATRGRGNALRLAVSGQFSEGTGFNGKQPNWNDEETKRTLHLCLSCKACKSECPSNVDIARLKAEYTAQGYRAAGGAPWRARVFGNVRALNRLGSMLGPLANWGSGLGVTRWLTRRLLGIDERRSLPRFERSLHRQVRSGGSRGASGGVKGRVVLYADCFTVYNEPRIGLAAVRVLERLGYSVQVLPGDSFQGCCGRAMISMGLLEDARATIDRTLGLLRPAVEDEGVLAVVVCEPSCLSAIKDDWLELKVKTPLEIRKKLAGKAWLVEEFVERVMSASTAGSENRPITGKPILVHGHCHQKALWGSESSAGALRRLVGGAGEGVRVLDTGCCGMAGSFGFTADRYDLSMKIGELALLPAVRAAEDGTVVCAPGTSCRHQIKDATGREALHPIEVIDQMMAGVGGVDQG